MHVQTLSHMWVASEVLYMVASGLAFWVWLALEGYKLIYSDLYERPIMDNRPMYLYISLLLL